MVLNRVQRVWKSIPEVLDRCVQNGDSYVKRSIQIRKSWKIDHFLIQRISICPYKLVYQKATHRSYPYASLGHVTVADFDFVFYGCTH